MKKPNDDDGDVKFLVSHMHIADTNIHKHRGEPKQRENEKRREGKNIENAMRERGASHREKRTIGKYLCMCRLGACSYTFEYTAYKSAHFFGCLRACMCACVCIPYPHVFVKLCVDWEFFGYESKAPYTEFEFVCESEYIL